MAHIEYPVSDRGDLIVRFSGNVYWRWWWRNVLVFGFSATCGIRIYLGPLGQFHYWPTEE